MSIRKSRKLLDDSLAQAFVYGGNKPEPEPAAETAIEPNPPQEQPLKNKPLSTVQPTSSNLMSKLQLPSKEPTIRFTVDLPESMHRKLSMLAAKTGRKKADIVRLLLEEALKEE